MSSRYETHPVYEVCEMNLIVRRLYENENESIYLFNRQVPNFKENSWNRVTTVFFVNCIKKLSDFL